MLTIVVACALDFDAGFSLCFALLPDLDSKQTENILAKLSGALSSNTDNKQTAQTKLRLYVHTVIVPLQWLLADMMWCL